MFTRKHKRVLSPEETIQLKLAAAAGSDCQVELPKPTHQDYLRGRGIEVHFEEQFTSVTEDLSIEGYTLLQKYFPEYLKEAA